MLIQLEKAGNGGAAEPVFVNPDAIACVAPVYGNGPRRSVVTISADVAQIVVLGTPAEIASRCRDPRHDAADLSDVAEAIDHLRRDLRWAVV